MNTRRKSLDVSRCWLTALLLASLAPVGCVGASEDSSESASSERDTAGDHGTGDSLTAGAVGELVWDLEAMYAMSPGDAKPAVDAAIADASRHLARHPADTVVLSFPSGTWTFHHPEGDAILLGQLRDGHLVLRGEGSNATTLVFDQFDQRGIEIESSRNIAIERLHLTRTSLSTSQGTVTAVEPGHVHFQVHPGFPDPVWLMTRPNAQDNERTLLRFRGDPRDPQLAPNANKIMLRGMRDAGGGLYDALLKDQSSVPDLAVGDWVALKTKVGDKMVAAHDVDDLVIRDVRITRSSAVPIAVDGASNRTQIRRVRIERVGPIQGRTPFFSGPGGGPQLSALVEGPTIKDCYIEGTTDDAIAIFSSDSAHPMSGAVVSGNTIRDGQGRGINITQSRDGTCTNNTISRTANASIQLKSNQDADGIRAAAVTGWRVAGNTLHQAWSDAAIFLTVENGITGQGEHDDIDIEGNLFTEAPKNNAMVQVGNTNRVRINNNTIASFSAEEDVPGKGVPQPAPLVYVEGGRSVLGTGNTYEVATSRPTVVETRNNDGDVRISWSLSAAGP